MAGRQGGEPLSRPRAVDHMPLAGLAGRVAELPGAGPSPARRARGGADLGRGCRLGAVLGLPARPARPAPARPWCVVGPERTPTAGFQAAAA